MTAPTPSTRRPVRPSLRRARRRAVLVAPSGPTVSLREAAPEFAELVAKVFPRNHHRYFALPMARRHLAHVILSRTPPQSREEARALADALESMSADRLIATYVPDPPPFLANALSRLDDGPWSRLEYANLHKLLLLDDDTPGILLHLRPIRPAHLLALQALPSQFRSIQLVMLASRPQISLPLAETLRALSASIWVDRAVLAERLKRAVDLRRVIRILQETIDAEPLEIDFSKEQRLERPNSVLELARIAVALKNCLANATHREQFQRGTHLYLKWNGAEQAAVELRRDVPGGWRLGHVAGVANCGISPMAWRELATALAALGVRVSGLHPYACLVELERAAARALRAEQ